MTKRTRRTAFVAACALAAGLAAAPAGWGVPAQALEGGFGYTDFNAVRAMTIESPAAPEVRGRPVAVAPPVRQAQDAVLRLELRRQVVAALISRSRPLTLEGRYLVYRRSFWGNNNDAYAEAQAEFLAKRAEFYLCLVEAARADSSDARVREIARWALETKWVAIELGGFASRWYDRTVISGQEYAALGLR